jgi:hypothetical protein
VAIWKLTPLDPKDPNWEASSHRAIAIVRAPNEGRAREAAQAAFGVKTLFKPGHGTPAPPWLRDTLVKAEKLRDTRYDSDGPTELLEPSL